MAKIVWTIKAQSRFDSIFETCIDEFGHRSANKLYDLVFKKVDQLIKYPVSCSPEPLLRTAKKTSGRALSVNHLKWCIDTLNTLTPF